MFPALDRRTRPPGRRAAGVARSGSARVAATALLLVATSACTRDVGLLSFQDAGYPADRTPDLDQRPDGGSGGIAGVGGAAGGAGGAGAVNGLCTSGPVHFPGATATCSATLAARSHRFALCSCSDFAVSAPLATDLLVSSASSVVPGSAPAAVGANGKITATASLSLRGSLYASGAGGIILSGMVDVPKTLHSAGPVTVMQPGTASVTGDAFIGGDATGALHVGGTLHLPPTATMGLATTATTTVRETVSVPPPCDCTVPFDIGGVIQSLSTTNDNASIGLNPNRLMTPGGTVGLDIPCGSYFLSGINSLSPINLSVHGRAMLAVGGDVLLSAGMTIIMDQGAELDLLIFGGITSYGTVPVGAYQAASLRIWIAGSSPLTFNGHPTIGGMFEAPLAPVNAPAGMEVDGSIVAASINLGDDVNVHYDPLILSSGLECGDPQLDPIP